MNIFGLFVGINYAGTHAALSGCINDARNLSMLFAQFCESVVLLLEAEANKARIVQELEESVALLRYDDQLVFTISSHGTWQPDTSGDEPDGRDECLCPFDFEDNLITDDELDAIFSSRKRGSRILFLPDCCHSGSVFRLVGEPSDTERRIKFLPPELILQGRKKKKAEAIAETFEAATTRTITTNAPKSGLIQISGCQDTEYSYDATIDGEACGAFTNAFISAYRGLAAGATYNDLMAGIATKLPSYSYPQRPNVRATAYDRRRVVVGK